MLPLLYVIHPTRCNTKKGTGLRCCLVPRTFRTIGIRPLLRGLPTQLSQCHWPRAAVVRKGHDTSVTHSACHEVPGRSPARHRLVIKLGPWRMRMKLTIGSSEGETSRLGHHVVSHLSPVCAIDFALPDRLAIDFALQLPLPLRQVLQQTRTKLCRLLLDPIQAPLVLGLGL